MFRTVRAVARVAGIALATIGSFVVYAIGRLFFRGATLQRWRTTSLRAWARLSAAASGMRLHCVGLPPSAPYFLVFNHLSYADALPLIAFVEHPMVCARHDFADWPVLGYITREYGAIWVRRKDFSEMPAVTQQMADAMRQGYGVIMAPEATTTDGKMVYPFHSTLFEPAVKLGVPVHYCSLTFTTSPGDPPAHDVVHWWQDVSFGAHAWRLLHVDYVEAVVHFGDAPIGSNNRKDLARKLHDAVSAIYQPA